MMSDRVEDSAKADQTEYDLVEDKNPFEFTFGFQIDNFSLIKYDYPVYSRPCIVHDLAWRIMFKKSVISKMEMLGLFLDCQPVSKNKKSSWSCYASAKLAIVNKKDRSKDFQCDIKHLFTAEESDWGFKGFCVLDNSFYLDLVIAKSIKFEVSVIADPPDFSDDESDSNSEDEVEESEDPIKTEINNLKSSMDLLAAKFQTEMSALRTDIADMMKLMHLGLNDHSIKHRGEHGANEICLGEEKKEAEKKIEKVDSTKIIEKNEMAKGDIIVEVSPKKFKENEEPKIEIVVENSPEVKEDEAKIVTAETPVDEDNELVSTDDRKNVDGVFSEKLETFIEDFEIVSSVEGKNVDDVDDNNSIASLSFEIISRDVDDDKTSGNTEETAKSDTVNDLSKEHLANENAYDVSIADLIYRTGAVKKSVFEILQELVEKREQEVSTNKEIKSCETKLNIADKVKKYLMETFRTRVGEDMVGKCLKEIAAQERSSKKESNETRDNIFENIYRDLENDDDRFFYPQHLINQETKQKCERRKTSSVLNSACACSKPQQMPSYRCHGEFRPPCHGFPPSFYNNHCQCQFFCSMKCSEKEHEDVDSQSCYIHERAACKRRHL